MVKYPKLFHHIHLLGETVCNEYNELSPDCQITVRIIPIWRHDPHDADHVVVTLLSEIALNHEDIGGRDIASLELRICDWYRLVSPS